MRLLRIPALHFLLIGAALFAWQRSGPAPRPAIVLTAADVVQLRRAFAAERGVPPGPATEAALVERAVEEEVLLREALARGLDRRERVVRDRLARLARFVAETPAAEEAGLEEEARRLGLERADLVVRRHLIATMRLVLARPEPGDLPSPAEVAAYLEREASRFAAPARVRLTHVYLAAERRGAAAEDEARRLLAALRREDAAPAAAVARGDAFLAGAEVRDASRADLERLFGPAFARAVETVKPRTWVGPLRSAYGFHLVWLHERVAAHAPEPASVANQVVHRLLRERGERRLAERLRALRARYDVRVERAAS